MRIICTATIEDEQQRNNLCQCVGILGETPSVSNKTVCVEYDGPKNTAQKFIELFEQYPFHGVSVISRR